MHPTLTTVGPWTLIHLPAVLAVFLAVVLLWTYLERRADGQGLTLTGGLIGQLLLEAAIPAVLTYLLINRVGPLQVRSYGVMMLAGFVACATWMYRERGRYGLDGRTVLQLALVGFAGGIIGARVGSVLLSWREYLADPVQALNLWRGGMAWHGGVIGGVLAVVIVGALMRVSVGRVFDLGAPGMVLAYAIARIGCFLNGCCHGHPTDLPWAVTFPHTGSLPGPPVPVHPTQLYALTGSLLFVLPLVLLMTRWVHRSFSRFMIFLILSSVLRFAVEFARRGATADPFALIPALTQAQAASIVIIVVCGVAIVVRERQPRAVSPAPDDRS